MRGRHRQVHWAKLLLLMLMVLILLQMVVKQPSFLPSYSGDTLTCLCVAIVVIVVGIVVKGVVVVDVVVDAFVARGREAERFYLLQFLFAVSVLGDHDDLLLGAVARFLGESLDRLRLEHDAVAVRGLGRGVVVQVRLKNKGEKMLFLKALIFVQSPPVQKPQKSFAHKKTPYRHNNAVSALGRGVVSNVAIRK